MSGSTDTPHPLTQYEPDLSLLCARYGIETLYLFGSAVRLGINQARDVDVIITLRGELPDKDLFDRYFEFKFALEKLFRKPVDVVMEDAIRNPHFKRTAEAGKILIYAHSDAKISD